MKKNPSSQSAFMVPRILLGLVFLLAGVSVALVGFGQSRTTMRPVLPYRMGTDLPDVTPTPTPTPAMTFTVTSTADTDGTTCGSTCTSFHLYRLSMLP